MQGDETMAAMKELLARTMDRLEAEGVPAEELEERAIAVLEAEMASGIPPEPVRCTDAGRRRGCGMEDAMIDHQTVTEFARHLALHDIALTLAQGEDIDGLAWGPEHTSALAKRLGTTVDALIDAVGEDTWAELIGAAQNAYDRWMQWEADESRELSAERSIYGWSVVDARGGRWWPSDEAQELIEAAENPAYAALRGCISGELRGEWRS